MVRFEFITGGCGDATELSDGTLVVYENGASTTSSFAIDAFTFNAASELQTEVYFHCEVQNVTWSRSINLTLFRR